MSWRTRVPRWLYTILMLALVALFLRLALWQYHRAHERAAQIQAAASALRAPASPLDVAQADQLPRFSHVYVVGRYDAVHQVLLSERPQPDGDLTGFEVLTPIELHGGRLLLVDRGWIPENGVGRPQADLAAPAGPVRATGYLGDLPEPGLRLGPASESPQAWPAVLLFPRWSDLERRYGSGLVKRLLLLEAGAQGGYDRAWPLRPRHGPAENYSYMAQWLGFALATFVVWLLLIVRGRGRGRGRTERI